MVTLSFPRPSRFLFCIVVIFPTREMMGNCQRVPTTQRAAIRFSFFFSSLISFRFVRLYVLLSPSDCHDDHQAGNRLSGIRGRDIKKNQAIPGEWAPSSLVSVIGRRMSFQRAKLSDILLDNEQVVSIYKERIFIPPLVPLQNVVAYNIIGRRRQTDEAHDGWGGPKDWRELLHGASTIRGM